MLFGRNIEQTTSGEHQKSIDVHANAVMLMLNDASGTLPETAGAPTHENLSTALPLPVLDLITAQQRERPEQGPVLPERINNTTTVGQTWFSAILDQATRQRVEALLQALNSERFPERERAQRDLLQMGPSVLRYLEQELNNPRSEEVRQRLQLLVRELTNVDRLHTDRSGTVRDGLGRVRDRTSPDGERIRVSYANGLIPRADDPVEQLVREFDDPGILGRRRIRCVEIYTRQPNGTYVLQTGSIDQNGNYHLSDQTQTIPGLPFHFDNRTGQITQPGRGQLLEGIN